MANVANECAHLQILDLHTEALQSGNDTLSDILNLQADTQKNVYGYNFDDMKLSELMSFVHMNNHAMIDELHEFTDALGGIKDGSGSAIWKRWKSAHETFKNKKFSDLSPEDQLEAKFEIIDILHFFMNMGASIGMTGKEMYNMYMTKNLENRNRQKNGY